VAAIGLFPTFRQLLGQPADALGDGWVDKLVSRVSPGVYHVDVVGMVPVADCLASVVVTSGVEVKEGTVASLVRDRFVSPALRGKAPLLDHVCGASLVGSRGDQWVSAESPAACVACWGEAYDGKVRSSSRVRGVVRHVKEVSSSELLPESAVVCMYPADVGALAVRFRGKGVSVMTVQDLQGGFFKHVWLFRPSARDGVSGCAGLYDDPAHVVAAMSRCTESFVYVSEFEEDLVSRWIRLGSDSRRVEAASEVASAGAVMDLAVVEPRGVLSGVEGQEVLSEFARHGAVEGLPRSRLTSFDNIGFIQSAVFCGDDICIVREI